MSVTPPVTFGLDSLLLTAGLFTFWIGFALEWVRTRETAHGYARTSLVLSVVCGLLFVGSGTNFIPTTTVATYTLIGLQIGAIALLFPVLRRWLTMTPPTPP
ncbi:hypothetical protein [Halocatena marina]|uniref:Uncharacterized protein n=1 Tax=Halocatena marina TaxID=2934937 RepID=A0ABD5YRJ3_9EURY|nr:hypothetical protein [Halocatena marina]